VLDRAKQKTLPVLNRVPDLAPATQACCGVCRTCATTNLLALAGATLAGATYFVARHVRRILERSSAPSPRTNW
jgi:hypothetical protein